MCRRRDIFVRGHGVALHAPGFSYALHLWCRGGEHSRRLADQLRGSRAVLREGRMGAWRVRRSRASAEGAAEEAASDAAAAGQLGAPPSLGSLIPLRAPSHTHADVANHGTVQRTWRLHALPIGL